MDPSSSNSSSELRILLLGPKLEEKSSAGNTILDKKEFYLNTLQCVEKHSERAGKKITVVDTPGWWGNLPFEENPELYKQEIILSVTKCPPGPHVLLLVLNVDTPFKENEKDILCGNMKCFGHEVWRHTIVLFTCEDHHTSTQQFIENENLQWLIEKCGNRYHELDTKNWGNGSQVIELLNKIQEMVEGNRGRHYELNREILKQVEEKRREQEKRANIRRIKNQQLKDATKTTDKIQKRFNQWLQRDLSLRGRVLLTKAEGLSRLIYAAQSVQLESKLENKHPVSELRMVLLGYNGSGKSSAGNTILGKSVFDYKRSLTSAVQEGDVAGRHITMVDTPGRRRNYHSKYTPRLYKDEIVLCSSHCPPGPHAFLLIIRVDVSFTEVYRKAVEEHVALLGLNVWDHMIVLFTFGDWLRDTSIELFIESEGEALQWIIDKCGNRYHVFNNRNTDDGNQVTELFEKIEEMVAGNRGSCFKIQQKNLEEVQSKRMKVEKLAKQMKAEVKKRNDLRHSTSGVAELFEMRLVLLGPHHSGISSTGNTILGRQVFDRRMEENLSNNGEVAGRKLSVVCTPGFEKDFLIGKRLEDAKRNLLKSLAEQSSGPHAFILVQSVDCSFAEEEKGALMKIMEPFGEGIWNHILVLFAVGEELGETPIELFIASEGDALQWLIEKCGNRYHVLNTKNWSDGSQVAELLEKIEETVAGNRGCHFRLDEDTLKWVERTIAVPITRSHSMDDPMSFSGRHSFSSGIGSGQVSQRSQEAPEESSSKMSSGVESLSSIPEFD